MKTSNSIIKQARIEIEKSKATRKKVKKVIKEINWWQT